MSPQDVDPFLSPGLISLPQYVSERTWDLLGMALRALMGAMTGLGLLYMWLGSRMLQRQLDGLFGAKKTKTTKRNGQAAKEEDVKKEQ